MYKPAMTRTSHESRNRFFASYACLEKAVQARMIRFCGPYCRACLVLCCKVHYCCESEESPFLKHLTSLFPPVKKWSEQDGWLTPNGCALTAGRPPVCYAFSCDAIAMSHPTPAHRYALNVLSALMSYAGRNAYGRRHLVELLDMNILNLERLQRQCDTARKILNQLELFWADPSSNPLPLAECKKICSPGRLAINR
jgi:hypothetical protein